MPELQRVRDGGTRIFGIDERSLGVPGRKMEYVRRDFPL
ncbi:MAG: hypothetical protein K0R28_1459 [Paenibacillus sp.]|jgi:hypothetical protein|nr:hypothetical protein [Paenibacillus sp.]